MVGLRLGRWVTHFGTGVMMLVVATMLVLLVWHPDATAAHPHVSPQVPFAFGWPAMTLLTLNLYVKVAFNALSGLEQVAVFAGETKNAARSVMLSAWIAAPAVVVIYVLMTSSMLTYTPSAQIDLAGPIPQVLAAALGAKHRSVAGTIDDPGAHDFSAGVLRPDRRGNEQTAHGRGLGLNLARLVQPPASTVRHAGAEPMRDCGNLGGRRGDLQHGRGPPGSIPGTAEFEPDQLRHLLLRDVRGASAGGRTVRSETWILAALERCAWVTGDGCVGRADDGANRAGKQHVGICRESGVGCVAHEFDWASRVLERATKEPDRPGHTHRVLDYLITRRKFCDGNAVD